MRLLTAIVAWALRNRAIVLVATLLAIVLGVRAARTLTLDAVPDVTGVQVQVVTASPALSPVEMEQYVTVPVERAMAGIPHTTELRSISKYGMSIVTIVFEDSTDVYFARQLVNERMRDAIDAIPAQYGKPEMGPISSALGEIYQFVLRNDRLSSMELQEVLHWQIVPQLRTVPGVVELNGHGGDVREYAVLLDPGKLQAAGVSVAQVVQALEKSNSNIGGGYIEHNQEQYVIRSAGLITSLDDLRAVVIGVAPQGAPVTIATVGDVAFAPRLKRGAATKDGKGEVVAGITLMLTGENARTVTAAVKAKLAELQPSLPAGTVIEPFYDRSILVSRAVHTLAKNLGEGALIVIAILFLLLRDLRSGLVVALVIPLALLFAIAAMASFGLSGNLMSLGALDFGLIVDGAVIIVENASRKLSEGRASAGRELTPSERTLLVERATVEVRTASLFGELIIAIVYLPLLALTGTEGKLFRPMALTVLLALFGAFILSITLVPVLASLLVKPETVHAEPWILRRAGAALSTTLAHAMRHPRKAMAGATIALVLGAGLFATLGAEFIPQLDEGDVLLEVHRVQGVSLSESIATCTRIEKALASIPEVVSVVSRTGSPEVANDAMGVDESDVYIRIKAPSEWRASVSKASLVEEIAERVAQEVPEVAVALSQPIQMRTNELIGGVKNDVALVMYGPDLQVLSKLGDRAADALRTVKGAVDVRVEPLAGMKYLEVVPNRSKLARYGLTVADVNQMVETMAVGHHTGDVLEGERRFALTVKVNSIFAGDLAAQRALPLRSPSGQLVPLGDVATLALIDGPAEVNREAQSRRIVVEFNVRGRDMLSTVHEAQAKIAALGAMPRGYRTIWGGQFEHYQEAKARLAIIVPLALALIVFMLWLALGSVRDGLLIFLNVPFAVVGGVCALAVRGLPFSISAGVGFIALFGVAVLNGLVLVSFARQRESGGEDPATAIAKAARIRLRPVLMTALVASLGLLPMALSTEPGAEVQRPLATVVIGGLITATLVTLVVFPIVYAWMRATFSTPSNETDRSVPTTLE
jgi:heavy metal efflux system protein